MSETYEEPSSPCDNTCDIDASSGLCEGCYRTMDEITEWVMMTPERKLAVLEMAERRREQAQ